MLPKRERLTAQEVKDVLAHGRSIMPPKNQSPILLSMKFLASIGHFKCAVVVPKSLASKATLRNSLRRRVYRDLMDTPHSSLKGKAVFFVRGIPKKPLVRIFAQEIRVLLEKL